SPHQEIRFHRIRYYQIGPTAFDDAAQGGNDAEIESSAFGNSLEVQSQIMCGGHKIARGVAALPIKRQHATVNHRKVCELLIKLARGSIKLQHSFSDRIYGCRFDDG